MGREDDVLGTTTRLRASHSWRHRLLVWGGVAAASYVGLILLLLAVEDQLVYQALPASASWQEGFGPGVQEVVLSTPRGGRFHGRWFPAEGATSALLYCHGNGGNLSHRTSHVEMIRRELGESVLIFDYPGYGKSQGAVGEEGCYDAAEAAYDWLRHTVQLPPDRITLFGVSLGGGVAVDLAARRPHRALLLASTFTSLPEVGQAVYPWLPVRWMMRNRFDSLGKIGQCPGPVVITHGTADTLIPFAQGEALFAAAPERKLFLPQPGVGHVDPPAEFFRQVREFLKRDEAPVGASAGK